MEKSAFDQTRPDDLSQDGIVYRRLLSLLLPSFRAITGVCPSVIADFMPFGFSLVSTWCPRGKKPRQIREVARRPLT